MKTILVTGANGQLGNSIRRLAAGYPQYAFVFTDVDTKIGVDGTFLSGGEQQRIVLARAILKDAPIVVLDEATAFADPENEHLIQKALHELRKGKTVLMIAHHLTSVQDADKILVIAQGKIAEEGTHSELIARNGIYNSMWNEYQRTVTWTV